MNTEFFKNPTTNPEYSTSGFWFWNTQINDPQTTEQLDIMSRINANQPVVHARSGLKNEYLSADWFDRIRHATNIAKKNGQILWLYDENNWPSGNCNWILTKVEENREHFLQYESITLVAGESYSLNLSAKNYINVTAYTNSGDINLLETAKNDTVTFTTKDKCEIYAVYIAVDDYEPMGKFSIDYLNKDVIKLFIESTHEKYAKELGDAFGDTIVGIFMDETRFCNANPWTKTLPEEFKKRKGYDLIPLLPLMRKKDNRSNMLRFDYYDVISDMYNEATFLQVYNWCQQHDLKATGHFLGEETIATQSYFGADMLRGFKHFHLPGIDHLGNGIGSLNGKFASSACYSYGKTRIACEAFGAASWDIDYEDLVRISNWLFQQGINLFWMHGFYYSIEGERYDDFPPSYFYQWRYWDNIPDFILMSNRMQEMLSEGVHEAEILVYTPIESFWNHYQPDLEIKTGFFENGPWIEDEKAKFINTQHQIICNKLIDKNLDFDIFHADAVANFKVVGNKLVNKLLGIEYEVFILPVTDTLTEDVAKLLNTFTENGGKLISYNSSIENIFCKDGGHMRGEVTTTFGADKAIQADKLSELIEICSTFLHLPFEILMGTAEISHSLSSYPDRLLDPFIHDGERLYGVGITRYIKDGHRILNFTNYNLKDEDLTVWVRSKNTPQLLIPETGEVIQLATAEKNDNGFNVSFTIPKNRAYFIVCDL